MINAALDEWFTAHTSRDHVSGDTEPGFFAPEARADYLAAAHDPRMCGNDRAVASVDLAHDRASRLDGVKVRCPMLVLWDAKGRIGGWYDPLALWREYCGAPVTGGAVASGHYLEEASGEVLEWLEPFLADAEQVRTRA